jgi:hypothetical protein
MIHTPSDRGSAGTRKSKAAGWYGTQGTRRVSGSDPVNGLPG